jgi:hypothetical protein
MTKQKFVIAGLDPAIHAEAGDENHLRANLKRCRR